MCLLLVESCELSHAISYPCSPWIYNTDTEIAHRKFIARVCLKILFDRKYWELSVVSVLYKWRSGFLVMCWMLQQLLVHRMMVRRKTTTVKVRRKQKRTAKGEVREYEKDYTEAGYSLIVANDRNEHFIPWSWLTLRWNLTNWCTKS